MTLTFRTITACTTILLGTALATAAEPAPTPGSSVATEGPTIELPKFEVSASRLREIDKKIKRLEKEMGREKKRLEKSTLDDTLNNEKVSRAAALFGGKSAVQRVSVAAVRVESMTKELALLDNLRTPLTADDRALAEKLIDDQRKYRRELDLALR